MKMKIFACRYTSKFPTSCFQHYGYQSFIQADTIMVLGMIKHSQSTQSNNFAISLQYLKKKLGMEFIIKVSTGWHYSF